jgi:hypothetical protein
MLKNKTHANFRFNKAGQGCFYSGIIEKGNQSCSIVYDCGTLSTSKYLLNEIEKFKKNQLSKRNRSLNMLIISHFDQDHVNHVSDLLKGLKKIDRVILPYLSWEERMYLYFQSVAREEADASGDYAEFMIDPVNYLSQYEVGEILFIGNGGQEINDSGSEIQPPEVPDELNDDRKFPSNGNSIHLPINDRNFKKMRISAPVEYINASQISSNRRVGFYRSGGKILVEDVWEFIFHVEPAKKDHLAKVTAFKKAVDEKLGLLKKSGHSKISSIKEIFKYYPAFAALYKDHFKTTSLNFSSIILYHKPTVPITLIYHKFIFPLKTHTEINSTLLMGDSPLKGLTLPSGMELEKVRWFQIPHHGAKTEWDNKIFNLLYQKAAIILNFGLGNRHFHPSSIVFDYIKSKSNFKVKLNHQNKAFKYHLNEDPFRKKMD